MTIIQGCCLEQMRLMESNSISAIVTDPPYGLSFMGKEWDYEVPSKIYWDGCFRLLAPGGFLIAMGGSRTFHRLACAIEDAGFQIRDCISWLYGSGFPKSHNQIGLQGYGTALKPAWEPCIVAMKPCDGTFKQNAEKWGQAGINIDGCRVAGSKPDTIRGAGGQNGRFGPINAQGEIKDDGKGRWPANVIFDEEAAQMLDEQSGILKSGKTTDSQTVDSMFGKRRMVEQEGSSGGASRFFYCAKASSSERNEGLEDRISEQTTDGCIRTNPESARKYQANSAPRKNPHPTVKPLKLMEYLIKLVMPPKGGVLLDPFAGSGTTILAARKLGYTAIGIEKEQQYCEIARARIESLNGTRQIELFTA